MEKNCLALNPILLPRKDIDPTKWACVACDQFTSKPEYWQTVKALTEGAESTYHITLPEIYLTKDNGGRIDRINRTMADYLKNDVFETVSEGMVIVERRTPFNACRTGLVVSVDLEHYSWEGADKALIRATEGTVLDRIPPRVRIRENAPLELPHIMLLIDDETDSVMTQARLGRSRPLYDFDLNMNGGHIAGHAISDPVPVLKQLDKLLDLDVQTKKYGAPSNVLFAVGDGNHSLASAKVCWNNLKKSLSRVEAENHPARFALVEIVNIYDLGIAFHPIHRIVFDVDADVFCAHLQSALSGADGSGRLVATEGILDINMSKDAVEAVESVDKFIADYAIAHPEIRVDYVHGDKDVQEIIASSPSSVGILLPCLSKSELFRVVARGEVLPRKTFSMGEGVEKRYYLEARKIVD